MALRLLPRLAEQPRRQLQLWRVQVLPAPAAAGLPAWAQQQPHQLGAWLRLLTCAV